MSIDHITKQTEHWLCSFIIKYNICPFAKQEHDKSRIRYSVIDSTVIDQCLENLILECERLDTQAEIETTLIIYPNSFKQFDNYLDFLDVAESLLIKSGYEGIYQLASFHPLYCFNGEKENDPANYTNRSPYPMLHLIREASLEKALAHYPNPEQIPERNIKFTRKLGLEKLQALLKQSINTENKDL